MVGIKALVTIGAELTQIREQLTRLANAAEGIPAPARPLPEELPEPPMLAHPSESAYAEAYDLEQRLRKTLGRDPTADEILHELDGLEHDRAARRRMA